MIPRTTFLCLFFTVLPVFAGEHVIAPWLHHLRNGDRPEWSDFPKQADNTKLDLGFTAKANQREAALRLRQQDVRQTWKVVLNGKDLGRLRQDENDMVVYFAVPPQTLRRGANLLLIEPTGKIPDDIRVGAIAIDDRPVQDVLSEATVEVTVADADRPGEPLPCRLTIVGADGALATVGAVSSDELAVRPGVIYTATGRARFGVPAGTYTVYAGRGFEYGVDSVKFSVKPGAAARHKLTIRREVPVVDYVGSDTHIHTLTHSGHGDSTLSERVITIAGEGLQLPISTEHNKQVDYHATAVKHGVRKYFTPVVGNEVTTSVGHFNIFPAPPGGEAPDFKLKDWQALSGSISKTTGAKAVILNHGRDLHSRFRPFGPERHVGVTGEDLDGWTLPANAMEVVNSGAQQTDVMTLVHDWLGILNRGRTLTPVGSSDSHDVSRYIVSQGRTYIRSTSKDAGNIDVNEAVDNFIAGRVLVSCGLLAEITVNDRFGPGDVVPADGEITVAVRVRGPGWVQADSVELYANGVKVREARIGERDEQPGKDGILANSATQDAAELARVPGTLWHGIWKLPRPRHDVHLVAVATGPGVKAPYWPIARPYQPTTRLVIRRAIGMTGAVWLDADGDGKRTSALDYAKRVVDAAWPNVAEVVKKLESYDEAVALQAASVLRAKGVALLDPALHKHLGGAAAHVQRAFGRYAAAWRESQVARSEQRD